MTVNAIAARLESKGMVVCDAAEGQIQCERGCKRESPVSEMPARRSEYTVHPLSRCLCDLVQCTAAGFTGRTQRIRIAS